MEKPISYFTKKGGKFIYPVHNVKGKFLQYCTLAAIKKLKPIAQTPTGGFIIKGK